MGSIEVGRYQRSEFLLAGCVPDAEFDLFVMEVDRFVAEVNGSYELSLRERAP